MPKFQKGNKYSFKPQNVPHNKGVESKGMENVPAPYSRLSVEMHQMVSETPSSAEGQEMLVRPRFHHLLRPRKAKNESLQEGLNVNESEQ